MNDTLTFAVCQRRMAELLAQGHSQIFVIVAAPAFI